MFIDYNIQIYLEGIIKSAFAIYYKHIAILAIKQSEDEAENRWLQSAF